jgi:hypothetical protein
MEDQTTDDSEQAGRDIERRIKGIIRCTAELERVRDCLDQHKDTATVSERWGCLMGQMDWLWELHIQLYGEERLFYDTERVFRVVRPGK